MCSGVLVSPYLLLSRPTSVLASHLATILILTLRPPLRHAHRSSLAEVPNFSEANPGRKVTAKDIAELIRYAKDIYGTEVDTEEEEDEDEEGGGEEGDEKNSEETDYPEYGLEMPSLDDTVGSNNNNNNNNKSSKKKGEKRGEKQKPERNLVFDKAYFAPRQDIDRVLGTLRPEINRLAELRRALQDVMDGSDRSDNDVNNDANNLLGDVNNSIRRLQDQEEEYEDLQVRYGDMSVSTKPITNENFNNGVPLDPMVDADSFKKKLDRLKLKQALKGKLAPANANGPQSPSTAAANEEELFLPRPPVSMSPQQQPQHVFMDQEEGLEGLVGAIAEGKLVI